VISRVLFTVLVGALLPSHALAASIQSTLNDVARELDAHVGFYMHDLHSGETLAYAADDRFPLNSTFKLFACAALLSQAEEGMSSLSTSMDLGDVEIESWSPAVTESLNAGHTSATLDELCRMMLSVSDNTAANLVLKEIGGPEGFTAFMRSLGDEVTRLDRYEPELNEGLPADPRDTTTPRAIARALEKLLLGQVLNHSSRDLLREWLSGHRVADDLFRAALPPTWSIDDRTGAGGYGTRGIVAVLYPPGRNPIVAALYMRDADVSLDQRNAAIARIGEAIVLDVISESSIGQPSGT